MGEDSEEIVAAIDALSSVDGADDRRRLRELADRYFTLPGAAENLDVWFRLYERFPEDDGEGVFWPILHEIEAQPGYEVFVVASVHRRQAYFPVLMVNRMLNGGIASVGGVDLLALLRRVAADEQCPPSVRQEAEDFLEHQRHRE
jgi:hypothetical protein